MGCCRDEGNGARIIIYLLALPIIFLYSVLMAGCVSESAGMPNLHLMELHQKDQPRIRIGYYGMCILVARKTDCLPTALVPDKKIMSQFRDDWGNTTLDFGTMETALKIQQKGSFNVMIAGLVLFILSLVFELLRTVSINRRRTMQPNSATKRRRTVYRHISLVFIWSACASTFAAALAQTQTAKALGISAPGMISIGPISCALHWATWAVSLMHSAAWTTLLRPKPSLADRDTAFDFEFGASQPLSDNAAVRRYIGM